MTELAHGDYSYSLNGVRQAISEPWTLTHSAGGLALRGQRIVDGRVMLDIDARYRAGRCVEMKLAWDRDAMSTARHAHYRLPAETLNWQLDGKDHALTLPANCLLFPLLRAAAGPLLRLLRPSPRPVLVPCIRDPADTALFLQPLLSQRRVVEFDSLDERVSQLRYYGGEYGDGGCDCWIDEHDLIQRYTWNSTAGLWEIQLIDAAVAPGFRGFAAH